MTKEEFLVILERFLEGSATETEKKLLNHFYAYYLNISEPYWKEWELSDKERIQVELLQSLNRSIDEDLQSDKLKMSSQYVWRWAASVVIMLSLGIGLYLAIPSVVNHLTYTTQRGQHSTFVLPDGSVVKLNAESEITFPEEFTHLGARKISLKGEAFFEVARDESKPFIIQSEKLTTTVLGTSFNIKAYPEDEFISVTVVTGKVEVLTDQKSSSESILLTRGKQGFFSKGSSSMTVNEVDPQKYLTWTEGTILLEDTSLEEATEILGRWYDVNFIFDNPAIKECTVDGKFKNDKLVNILENLKFLMGIEYQIISGNTIILNGKSCS